MGRSALAGLCQNRRNLVSILWKDDATLFGLSSIQAWGVADNELAAVSICVRDGAEAIALKAIQRQDRPAMASLTTQDGLVLAMKQESVLAGSAPDTQI